MAEAGAPRVSVIVRTKDRPRLLAEALESLRAQTFGDFEVLVINDGGVPPAGLPTVGAGLRVVTTASPHGRSKALNTGLQAARGRFVAYLDDDDLWLPNHLEVLERFLSGTDSYRAAYADVRVVMQTLGGDGHYHDARTVTTYDRPFVRARLLSSNTVPLIGLLHDRELGLAVGGFDESFDLYEDWDFLIRLSEKTRFHRLPGVTSVYRLRDDASNATTGTPWQSAASEAARERILRKHWSSHSPATQVALVDSLTDEKEEARAVTALVRQELESERAAHAARQHDLERELAETRHSVAAAEARAKEAAEEALLVRADAARQLQAAGERETALAAEAAKVPGLEATLHAVHRSLAWRLFSPWWKLKRIVSR
jgi:hypothetical protein